MREPLLRILGGLRRRPVLEVTLACLAVLLLAQTLMGALSLAALDRLIADTTADRVEVVARRVAGNIDNGLRLGKPLAQYFGMDALLRDGTHGSDDLAGIAVLLPDGSTVASQGDVAGAATLARALFRHDGAATPHDIAARPSGALLSSGGGRVLLAVPLASADPAKSNAGALVVSAVRDAAAAHALMWRSLAVLVAVTALVGVALAAAFKFLVPLTTLAAGGRARFVVPLVALLLAQGVYAVYTVQTFREGWLRVTRENVAVLARGLQTDLDRIIGYGIAVDKLRGVEAPFQRLAATFPAIREIDLTDAGGHLLNRADSRGPLPLAGGNVGSDTGVAARGNAVADDLTLVLPLTGRRDTAQAPVQGATQGATQGNLVLRLSADVLGAGVRSRMIDAITVVAVALVAAMEMLLLLSLLMNRAFAARGVAPDGTRVGPDDASDIGRIARPIMFGFLFAWAMPLSFLPLYARTLPEGWIDLPPNVLLALPISVEMGCGLLTALLAGRLTDRRGWQFPVLSGLGVTFLGMLACAGAGSLPIFAGARGLVGLGYGLTWMGLQGFIVTRSSPQYRGRNMTTVIAGLFAGHLTGAAVGAMLMEQLGFRLVFGISAFMLLMPVLGVLALMRPYMGKQKVAEKAAGSPAIATTPVATGAAVALPSRAQAAPSTRSGFTRTARLVFTRDFGLLLLGSVIPFSIAQVGLLSFALPLYLEHAGVAASSIGRVLMIYGLCVIYVGPLMGRLVDRSNAKKTWIVLGGVVGSAGMIGLYFGGGLAAATLAVFLLAVASCFSGASQSPYMLGLPRVQDYGAAGATSVMRAADKLGQMAGPLMVGALFGSMGMNTSLAIAGGVYLVATLLFLFFAPGRGVQRTSGA
ncbi:MULTISPECIES: MFS transporter [unclassified Achromobacter]|uniref:MFS transporter n=1 Tax=unclassified Achromobacter TaxID=2626865 RepID=UPI000B5162D5|nr:MULTISPECIES: MFS transporter [unclassified Achromobacter]OWT74730.1 MFS transporter [Achromobacter sp. HZ34]OWT79197.1 MFS transporter [Achromobacter sp. HZ28]